MKKTIPENRRRFLSPALLALTVLVVILSVWGPEALAAYTDKGILNQIHTREEETGGEGYRYQLSSPGLRTLFRLRQCLGVQALGQNIELLIAAQLIPVSFPAGQGDHG